MNLSVVKKDLLAAQVELIVLPVFASEHFKLPQVPAASERWFERVTHAAAAADFTGKAGQTLLVPAPESVVAQNFLLVGLGDKKKTQFLDRVREAAGHVVSTAKRQGVKTAACDVSARDFDAQAIEAFATAAYLADYTFETYRKSNGANKKLVSLEFVTNEQRQLLAFRKAIQRAQVINQGLSLARDLVNTPAQEMTPIHLAQAAVKIAEAAAGQIQVKILDRTECAKLNMGAYLAVAQGADHEPKFIHLTYTPSRPTKKTIAIVGKGVTFDSGGLSLKPADAMMTMKCDMAGAAAVLGFFATLADLKPRVNIHGVIAATENMVSGKAIRPGDIVTAANGKTIEILNTDAEGRLTLADAFTYILQENPDALIDLATLTGACVVALGEDITGLMTNDAALGKKVLAAAALAGEKMWELPLEKNYRDQIKSEIADLRNIATSRYGGSLTAGLFLEEFVNGKPWVHLDIAGPAFAERPMSSYLGKGGTGHGIRTLIELVEKF